MMAICSLMYVRLAGIDHPLSNGLERKRTKVRRRMAPV
jgi:hypothetical protein